MDELVENIRTVLFDSGELVEALLNALSLLVIIVAVVNSLLLSIREKNKMPGDHPLHTYFRRAFGGWLVVALELQLAADIVGTIITPTYPQLIQLGAIAVIRTFLNYFLGKELHEQSEYLKLRMEKSIEKPV